jgi:hypothetical protein
MISTFTNGFAAVIDEMTNQISAFYG